MGLVVCIMVVSDCCLLADNFLTLGLQATALGNISAVPPTVYHHWARVGSGDRQGESHQEDDKAEARESGSNSQG